VATGILKNEIYIGKLVWNHLRYIKDPATGKRRSRLNPEKDWIIKEVPELRIAALSSSTRAKLPRRGTCVQTRERRTSGSGRGPAICCLAS
jgi:Recombinase